jgi:GDPmannose 4,6-dehydratase
MKTALITGISGQDGSYLAEFLLKKNYKVIGTDRRSSRNDMWRLRFLGIENKVTIEDMELGEQSEIDRLFKKYKFDEVYNLAAQSFVASSFSSPINTSNITALGCLRILETIRNKNQKIKFYQASSSEMFGKVLESPQNENTPMNPQSPYAIAKTFAHYITKNYRESYNLFAVSGILFNHESPLRGHEFVTRKITIALAQIYLNQLNFLELGNIYAKRDWGYAKEYVSAMWKMLQQKKPDDFVISTGETYSIKDFINVATKILGWKTKWIGKGVKEKLINLNNNKTIIKINKKFYRPAEVNYLKGSSTKAKKILNWKNQTSFKRLVELMLKSDIKLFSNSIKFKELKG